MAGTRSVGILYEIWHTAAAAAMAQVAARNLTQLTVESVIRSANESCLDDVYPADRGPWYSDDIFNVKPKDLGFYCLYRARSEAECNATAPPTPYFPPIVPDCPMASAVAKRHASMLSGAGIDYVAVDITNWPQVNAATDLAVLRPLEVLMDEWLALRAQGATTPQVAVWCDAPKAAYTNGRLTTWQWLLDHVYNNATRAPLVWRRPSQAPSSASKMTFFVPDNGSMNATVNALIAANVGGAGGEIDVVSMWAMMGGTHHDPDMWAYFSACRLPSGAGTTSMIGGGAPGFGDCNQSETVAPREVSASGGYMLAQCALPWASPGHMRGLTLQRLFQKVLAVGAPDLFLSSFNEHIGGRQAPSQAAEVAINMGLPYDSQRARVWVDTYGAEFSRDLEPSDEGGERVWTVAQSCIALYRQGVTSCAAAGGAHMHTPCCSTEDKQIWRNVWSVGKGASGPAPPPPPPPLHCPSGYILDVVDAAGDNGSCKCATYCAANWGDSVKSQRPQWSGATSAMVPGSTTHCTCIQASHWCTPTAGNSSCSASCDAAGEPVPQDYCVEAPPDVPRDRVSTSVRATRDRLVAGSSDAASAAPGGWRELCAATQGSSVFCFDGSNPDGRDGPFMVYSVASAIERGAARELHRCRHTQSAGHFLSTDAQCDGPDAVSEELIGWIAPRPGGETLRALHRCFIPGAPANSSARTHALDLPCDIPDVIDGSAVLGYVR